MRVRSVSSTPSERHCDRDTRQGQQITGKLKERHTEPFRAVLLEVMKGSEKAWHSKCTPTGSKFP